MQAIFETILSAKFKLTIPSFFLLLLAQSFQLSGHFNKHCSNDITFDHRCFNLAPWMFKNHKISGSLRTSLHPNRSSVPYPVPTWMFLQTVVLVTRECTPRQTTCSQLHSIAYLEHGEAPEPRMQEPLWKRFALCWFRFQCHFSWLGLARCSLGCFWKWFRWGEKRMFRCFLDLEEWAWDRQDVEISRAVNLFLIKVKSLLLPPVFLWQSWDVFQEIAALLILVPALLGMKGNLEMTLASRLSTAVSLFSPP